MNLRFLPLLVVFLVLAFAGRVSGQTVGFSQAVFFERVGNTFQTEISVSPLPASGLFSYGLVAEVKGTSGLIGVVNLVPQAALRFDGVMGANERREVAGGIARVKGTVNFQHPAKPPFLQSGIVTLSVSGLSAGAYRIRLSSWNTLGPTEQLFVDGSQQCFDPSLLFGVADLYIGDGSPEALINSIGQLIPDRQTGMLLQKLEFTNVGGAPGVFRLWIKNIDPRIKVWNAKGTINGVPYIEINNIVPGQRVTLTIEYWSPNRALIPTPEFSLEPVIPEPTQPLTFSEAVQKRVVKAKDGMLLEFNTKSGESYYIQYSDTMSEWLTVYPAVQGTGGRIQWIDNGPPKTAKHPFQASGRFYRVMRP